MKLYRALGARGQVDRIRRVVWDRFEPEWGFRPARVELVDHACNTTFRIVGPRVGLRAGRLALRVNVGAQRAREKLDSEIAFVQFLSRAKTFRVAAPIPKSDGGYVAELPIPGFDGPVYAVLYEWLPDPTAGANATPERMRSLGIATRELHELGAVFPCERPPFRVLSDPYYGDPYRLPDHDLDLGLFEECAHRAEAVFEKLVGVQRIPLHADLHLYNLKFRRGRLSIFDFDDAMVAWPVMDPAITLWYVRRQSTARDFEPDLWEGLGGAPADFGVSSEDFETLVAARTLLLANDVVGSDNAHVKEDAARFLRRCEAVLRHYLATGRYAPQDVP